MVRASVRRSCRFLFVSLAMLGVSGLSLAVNTGTLDGVVLDNSGVPLPGVTVAITSDALIGGPRHAVSGPTGEFSFQLLLVGIYRAEASLAGYRTASAEVRIRSNHVGSVTFRMVPEHFSDEIVVLADVPVVDTSQVNSSVVWDNDYLQKATVGTVNRNYQTILAQAPGVSSGNNPTVFGGTYGENSYLIDGMNTTDPSFGTWGTMFNIDAVQEMNFQTGGFEAEFGQATGGIVNLVTKSGGNEFSGSVDVRYRNQSFNENGDHYDRENQAESKSQYSASLGGPFVRDRLWFFSSVQYIDQSSQDVGTYFPLQFMGWQFLAKATWQAGTNNRLVAKYSTNPAELPGINSDPFVLESAKEIQEQGGDFWQIELNSVLSPSWLLVAQAATNSIFTRGGPTDNPDTLSGHSNADTGLEYHNVGWSWDGPRARDEYRINASWFVDRLAGSHEFKGGLEYNKVSEFWKQYRNGGAEVVDYNPGAGEWDPVDLNGDGYFNYYLRISEPEDQAMEPIRSYGSMTTAFLQDTWRPIPTLTIKPGLRYDDVLGENTVGEVVADMGRWQPRLGIAWDVTGSARHVLRASVGRFMDPTSLMIPWWASGRDGIATHYYYPLEYLCNWSEGEWCDIDSVPEDFGEPRPWTNWAGQEYVLIDSGSISWPASATTVDQAGVGTLRAPYADEVIVAYETQIGKDNSLELSYVYKKSEDLMEDTCNGNAWAWGAAPYPDLGDPETWTREADCGGWMLVNMPGYNREYEAMILKFESRKSWGHLMASYTYSDAQGTNYSGPQGYSYFSGDYFPLNFYNQSGQMPDHRWHRVKLNGYVLLPKRFTIGFDGFWSSAGHKSLVSSCYAFQDAFGYRSTMDQMARLGIDPATVDYCFTPDGANLGGYTIFHWPRGSLQTNSVWQLDLQLSKAWQIGRTDLEVIATVYNLFGQELVDDVNNDAFLQDSDQAGNGLRYQDTDPSAPYYDEYYGADSSPVLIPIGEPLSYWDTRRYEIGVRIEF